MNEQTEKQLAQAESDLETIKAGLERLRFNPMISGEAKEALFAAGRVIAWLAASKLEGTK